MTENEANILSEKSNVNTIINLNTDFPLKLFPNNEEIDDLIFQLEKKISNEELFNKILGLFSLFKINTNLLLFFIRRCEINHKDFFITIVDIYLDENIQNEKKYFLEESIKFLMENVCLSKLVVEYLFQKLSKYYSNSTDIYLNESLLLKYLSLLEIFYSDYTQKKINNKGINNNNYEKDNRKINNYIYFNGINSNLRLTLNDSSINQNTDFQTLEMGCSFIFWIYLDKKLLLDYFETFTNIRISLIIIDIGKHKIELILKNNFSLQIIIDQSKSEEIKINSSLSFNEWNFFCFVIEKDNSSSIKSFSININNTNFKKSINILNDPFVSEKINNIILFNNLIGKITSFLFFSYSLEQQTIELFFSKFKYGFYKKKIIFQFINFIEENLKNINDDNKNHLNNKYENYFFKQNIKVKNQDMSNFISLFCPVTFNNGKNTIDDIFGNFIGVLSKNDGIINYINYSKNISLIGGVENLLPIIELMYTYDSLNMNNNKKVIDESILSENTLLKYLNIIKTIIISHKNNLSEAYEKKFFSNLSLFLERFPSDIYNENILNILLDIGKEIFQNEKNNNQKTSDNYITLLLLNEKIFSKFNYQNQIKLWKMVNYYFISDYFLIKSFFNITKFYLLLRFYDEDRYNKYCCKYHASLFNSKNNKNTRDIMNPEMSVKTGKLFEIIQIYIDELEIDDENYNLFQLLSLDLSPCLQKKIIQVYIFHFDNNSLKEQKKNNNVLNLLNNNFFEIVEYVLSISLVDVRITILQLFKILLEKYRKLVHSFLNEHLKENIKISNIFRFISENIIPDNLIVEIDNNIRNKEDKSQRIINFSFVPEKTRNRAKTIKCENLKKNIFRRIDNNSLFKEIIPLIRFFNNQIYSEQINILWNLLKTWITFESNDLKNNPKIIYPLQLNSFVIDFCISFVSKNPFFIEEFILSLYTYFNNESIINKSLLFENKNLYPWIIQTIFYLNNNQSENQDKIRFENLKNKSLDVFKYFLSSKREKTESTERIDFILNYSYYLKKLNDKDLNKKEEISRITNLLLSQITEQQNDEIIYITEIFFEFMIYYRYSEEVKNREDFIMNDNLNENFQNEDKLKLSEFVLIEKHRSSSEINTILEEEKAKGRNKNKKELHNKIHLPSYVIKGLNLYECDTMNKSKIAKDQKKCTLNEIWQNYSLYDYIIDYYYSNFWGIENLCRKVKVEYGGRPLKVIKKLLKEYGFNKSYRNILQKEAIKYIGLREIKNIEESTNNNKNKTSQKSNKSIIHFSGIQESKILNINMNILRINLILLSIGLEITKDYGQKEFIENQYQQFLTFCILYSINIKSNENEYEFIQSNLYYLIGFGCLFLKKKNELKYNEIVNYLVEPLFMEMNNINNRRGFKKILGISERSSFNSTGVFRLFGEMEFSKYNFDNDKIDEQNEHNKSMTASRYNSCFDLTNEIYLNNYCSEEDNIKNNNILNDESVIVGGKNKYKINYNLNVDSNKLIRKIFNNLLNNFKKNYERKNKINFYLYYENNKQNNKNDEIVIEEKKRVYEKIKQLITLVSNQIINYLKTSNIEDKKRKKNYKLCKSKLFSWRGFWSNKFLFFEHPEYLKLKIKNHYTKEMTKILLTPVLDVNYYIPYFRNFNKNKLFNNNNYFYRINLDIDALFKGRNFIKRTNIIRNNDIENKNRFNNRYIKSHIYKNKIYRFNYLECLYKLHYNDLWNKYKLFIDKNFNFVGLDFNKKEVINGEKSEIFQDKINSINNINIENNYLCCLIKPTNHVKGKIITRKDFMEYLYDNDSDNDNDKVNENKRNNLKFFLNKANEELENDISYDRDMGSCFGSIFKNHKKDKDIISLIIKYSDIRYMFMRNYYYRQTGIEIFTEDNKSFYFNFKNNEKLLAFIIDVTKNTKFRYIKTYDFKGKKLLGYERVTHNIKANSYYIINKMEEWQNYNISTLEYLMWLNIYAGRSFSDLTQYPVFPWILINYDNKVIKNKEDYRNLFSPIGMLDIHEKCEARKEIFLETYNSLKNEFKEANPNFNYSNYLNKGGEYFENYKSKKMKIKQKEEKNQKNEESLVNLEGDISGIELNQFPYNYGTHYSNPTYVSHYLCRIFPFSFVSIEIHGDKFDDPERMFFSISKTFKSITSLKDDIRELIPEFYFLPEIFINKNNLNLSQDKPDSDGNVCIINDVELPPWSNNNPNDFVLEMRKSLENNDIEINKWIDIIFGSYQRGEKAEEINNIFMAHTYEGMVKINEITNYDSRNALLRLFEVGATPFQIFNNDTKQRIKYNHCNDINHFLEKSKTLVVTFLKLNQYNSLFSNIKTKNSKEVSSKENKQIIYPKIIKIIWINNENLKIITNTNYCYNIKFSIDENGIALEQKSNITKFGNSSFLFSPFYFKDKTNIPLIIYNQNRCIIKGGFWDGRLEINSIKHESKDESISSIIFTEYYNPIVVMELSKDEKNIFCGTKDGTIFVYEINNNQIEIKKKLFSHTDEITSISINENLNMFSSASVDGYIILYILPSFKIIRIIRISSSKNGEANLTENNENNNINTSNINLSENNKFNLFGEKTEHEDEYLYANNIFLSSSPLACVTVFISKKGKFRTYTINGEIVGEMNENDDSKEIRSAIVFKNLQFQDILIYGTNNGFIKIRSFPKMELINSIKVFEDFGIETLSISEDRRYCYAWGNKYNRIAIIKGL